jgi:hypothetical protein
MYAAGVTTLNSLPTGIAALISHWVPWQLEVGSHSSMGTQGGHEWQVSEKEEALWENVDHQVRRWGTQDMKSHKLK